MNAKLRHAVIILFVSLGLFLSVAHTYGQELLLPNTQLLQAQIDQQKELAAAWEIKANVEFLLVILVVVLGAVVALLQKVDGKKWCSYVVAVSGILISTLTFATKEYFEVDHKTYRKSAEAAKWEIRTAETYLAIINAPDIDPESKQELLVKVAKNLAKTNSIAERVGKTSSFAPASDGRTHLELVKTAYAQASSRPAWVSKTRTMNTTTYRFVASSTAASVVAAQSQALLNAQNAAASGLSIPMDRVKRYAILVDTYLEYNPTQRTYLCFALLELNKAFVRR